MEDEGPQAVLTSKHPVSKPQMNADEHGSDQIRLHKIAPSGPVL